MVLKILNLFKGTLLTQVLSHLPSTVATNTVKRLGYCTLMRTTDRLALACFRAARRVVRRKSTADHSEGDTTIVGMINQSLILPSPTLTEKTGPVKLPLGRLATSLGMIAHSPPTDAL